MQLKYNDPEIFYLLRITRLKCCTCIKNAAVVLSISTNNNTITVWGCNYPFCLISNSRQVNAKSVSLTHSPPLLSFLITQDKRGAIWSLELVWRMWVCSYCCQNCVPNTWCMGLRILLTCSIVPLQFFHIRSFVSFPSGSIWILSSSDDGGLSKLCELIAKSFLR